MGPDQGLVHHAHWQQRGVSRRVVSCRVVSCFTLVISHHVCIGVVCMCPSRLLSLLLQWKVRASLAQSIHLIAAMLGREITERDLMMPFDSLLKDVDMVCQMCVPLCCVVLCCVALCCASWSVRLIKRIHRVDQSLMNMVLLCCVCR